MASIIYRLLFLIPLLFNVSGNIVAQSVSKYKEVEQMGMIMLKKMESENVNHPMQYVLLKKNQRISRQIKQSNTIYEIRYTFNLMSSDLEVPENCVFVFNGGCLKNGRLIGNDTQYCVKTVGSDSCFECDTIGTFERVAYIVKASERGLVSNSTVDADTNYYKFRYLITNGYNVFLDGNYHIRFREPIYLNSVLRVYGGSLIYEKNAFRFNDKGGIVINGSKIEVSSKAPDSFFCGQKDYLDSITIKRIAFYNSYISCPFLVEVFFKDINSDNTPYGLSYLEMDHCVIKNTGRVRVLDAICSEKCSFTNNYYQSFYTTPIYICCHHSVEASPNDETAYRFIGQNLPKGASVAIGNNIFIGKVVSADTYYCAALIKSRECMFTGNYIQDVINYNDKSQRLSSTASAYDAYLSCVRVLYEGNYVKDMMSFAKNGRAKPECQIGKSKTNPLYAWGWKSERIYRNNCFIVDGDKFLELGADKESIYTDILGNGTYINHYVWDNNTLIYRNSDINTGVAANSYESFEMKRNYFEVARARGNGLVTIRSDQPLDGVYISSNVFRQTASNQLFPIFNQKYYQNYKKNEQKHIEIINNHFYNTAPKIIFFTGEKILVEDNVAETTDIEGNMHLSKYNGSGAYLDVTDLNAQMSFSNLRNKTGGIYQYISSSSRGKYEMSLKELPDKGAYFIYNINGDHQFSIECVVTSIDDMTNTIRIPIQCKKGRLMYEMNGKTFNVPRNKTSSQTWYTDLSLAFKTTFYSEGKQRVLFYLRPVGQSSSLSSVVFTYRSE